MIRPLNIHDHFMVNKKIKYCYMEAIKACTFINFTIFAIDCESLLMCFQLPR